MTSDFETKVEDPDLPEAIDQEQPAATPQSLLGPALDQVKGGFDSLMPKLY